MESPTPLVHKDFPPSRGSAVEVRKAPWAGTYALIWIEQGNLQQSMGPPRSVAREVGEGLKVGIAALVDVCTIRGPSREVHATFRCVTLTNES